jgi:signal transduction histidine kinase
VISRTSVRWQLVAWVTGVLIAASGVILAVVYEQTGNKLRAQINQDVAGDVSQLSQAVRALHTRSPERLLAGMRSYLSAQPFNGASSLLFAAVSGHGTASNHPELVGTADPDDGESITEQDRENGLGHALVGGSTGLSTRQVADVGPTRFDQRVLTVGGLRIRVGAGEPLSAVTRAERSITRSFVLAGALALVLALLASYLAGASISLPLRRMARVAARVDDGDLNPRMAASRLTGSEVRVLAESFNTMLDRLAVAFAAQREFIADASHELRTPLTVISGQLEVLAAQDHPDAEEVRRVERMVNAEISRISRLVDDMLLLARSDRRDFLRRDEIDLEPFVSELWWGASISDERHFELGPIPDATLSADADRLAQALRNLIRNAVEHTTEPDGLVRMEVDTEPGGGVRFAVIDDGPGIDPGELERVFERFHRTDDDRSREGGGAGLGLAIVMAIAHAHGGDARAVATAGGGARFELELPGLEPRRPQPGVIPVAAQSGAHGGGATGAGPGVTRRRPPGRRPPADDL